MNDEQWLLLAALTHDLPKLFSGAGVAVSTEAQCVLDLATLHERPMLAALLAAAESCTFAQPGNQQPLVRGPLVSAFSPVSLSDSPPPIVFRRLAPLPPTSGASVTWFPIDRLGPTRYAAYLIELAQALHRLASAVDPRSFETTYPHLLALLQRYGWCLPAHAENVSFYDHARLTAAVAVCMLCYHAAIPILQHGTGYCSRRSTICAASLAQRRSIRSS